MTESMTTELTAFDADVLIYAATRGHPLGERLRHLFVVADIAGEPAGIGSVLLLGEVLTRPLRADPDSDESVALLGLLSRLSLKALDEPTAQLALALGISYGLRAMDAAHLATAIAAGADRFLTNNRRDFPASITEIAITYPDQLEVEPSPHPLA